MRSSPSATSRDHGAARRDDGVAADVDGRDQGAVGADERAFADLRLVFEIAVIIAGDRARADVRACANIGVAQIGQVVGLGAFAADALS